MSMIYFNEQKTFLTQEKAMPKLLKFAAKSDPILRKTMPEIQHFEDASLHNTIDDMCYSIMPDQLKAANAPCPRAAGMAANQWGIEKRIFIFTPDGSEPNNRLEVMINPSYAPYLRPGELEFKLVAAYEGCFSVPLALGLVNRFDAISASYYTPSGDKVERIMEGWEARVFQHETDHLDGKLYDGRLDQHQGPDCIERVIFQSYEEATAWLMEKRAK